MVKSGPELIRAYKTPSLRGAATRSPYMHAGQFSSLGRGGGALFEGAGELSKARPKFIRCSYRSASARRWWRF